VKNCPKCTKLWAVSTESSWGWRGKCPPVLVPINLFLDVTLLAETKRRDHLDPEVPKYIRKDYFQILFPDSEVWWMFLLMASSRPAGEETKLPAAIWDVTDGDGSWASITLCNRRWCWCWSGWPFSFRRTILLFDLVRRHCFYLTGTEPTRPRRTK